jgi:peptidoglycan/LPS O-acetylase OafA/YrhL
MRKTVEFFPELAGVRALAALFVCFYHLMQEVPSLSPSVNPTLRWMAGAVTHDYITVDVFFVLSGFLITALLLRDQKAPHFFHNFYWRRVLRIMPVFLLALGMFWYVVPNSGSYIVLCLLLVANFSVRFGVPLSSPIWTLCIEEQFYFFWPQFLHRCKPRTIAWIAIWLSVFSIVLRLVVLTLRHGVMNRLYTFYRLDGLGLGALAACAYMAPEQMDKGLRLILKVLGSRILLAFAIVGFLVTPNFHHFIYQEGVSITLTCFLTFRFVYSVMRGRKLPFLGSGPLLFLASISYGIYMYHMFVVHYFEVHYGIPDMSHPWGFIVRAALVFGITIAAATASLYLIEKPAQHLRPFVLKQPANTREALVTQVHPEETDGDQINTGSRRSSVIS